MRRFFAIALLVAAGCTAGDEEPAPPTLAELQATIFGPRCGVGGCHGSVTPQEGLDLSSESATAASALGVTAGQTFNGSAVQRVQPGNASASYLYLKVAGTPGIQGTAMPQAGALTQAEIDSIGAWIDAGAN